MSEDLQMQQRGKLDRVVGLIVLFVGIAVTLLAELLPGIEELSRARLEGVGSTLLLNGLVAAGGGQAQLRLNGGSRDE